MSEIVVHHGDSRKVMKALPADSVDSLVTDAPYALDSIRKRFGAKGAKVAKSGQTGAMKRLSKGFMGQGWDTGKDVFDPKFWREAYRVAKPGAFVLCFGATRTYHRMACAIEDAGFEIVDMIFWAYGSGFPKSHKVALYIERTLCRREERDGKQRWFYVDDGAPMAQEPPFRHPEADEWWGWGTARKPAAEPICVAQKPLEGTLAANLLKHGVGAINIDDCRIAVDDNTYGRNAPADRGHDGSTRKAAYRLSAGSAHEQGRWPANVIHDGHRDVVDAFPDAPGQKATVRGNEPSSATGQVWNPRSRVGSPPPRHDDGSAARFFYSAKAKGEDRLGCDHPTMKPVDLMAYLVRHVTPLGGTVLDPFAGTGTTGIACLAEGMNAILIEGEAGYVADIHRRIAWVRGEGRLTALEIARLDDPEEASIAAGDDLPLFAGAGE